MALLLNLPAELLSAIIDNLSRDKNTLLNVCLVGSHILLDIARPLTWHEVAFVLDLSHVDAWIVDGSEVEETPTQCQPILSFVSDSRRVAAVRSISLRFIARLFAHDRGKSPSITRLLRKTFNKFTNATHVYVGGFELEEYNHNHVDSTESLVKMIVKSFPAMTSLHLDGYELQPFTTLSFVGLKEVVMRYCNPHVIKEWAGSPGLEVIELHGGNGYRFYSKKVGKGLYPDKRTFFGYRGIGIGAEFFMTQDMLKDGIFDSVKTLYLFSEMKLARRCYDTMSVTQFFKSMTIPLPSLTDLVLRMPFLIHQYHSILISASLYAPHLKRLMIEIQKGQAQDLVEAFAPVLGDETIWGRMEELEEVWLPMSGVERECEMITNTLLNLKALRHLYLPKCTLASAGPAHASAVELESVARRWAGAKPELRSVGWDDTIQFVFSREGGEVQAKEMKYERPAWIQGRGKDDW